MSVSMPQNTEMEAGMKEPRSCKFCSRIGYCRWTACSSYCGFIPYHGILTDIQISELIDMGIIQAQHDKVQPTSVDLHLGEEFFYENQKVLTVVEKCNGHHVHWSKSDDNFIILSPGQPCLASVREAVTLPSWLTMELRMTSTEGRDCIQHILAVWGDPGFNGRMTLELQNVSQDHAIMLSSGDRICQAIFHKHLPVGKAYKGRYNGDMTTQVAKSQK